MTTESTQFTSAKVADLSVGGIRDRNNQSCGISTKLAEEIGIEDPSESLVLVNGTSGQTILRVELFNQSNSLIAVDAVTLNNLGIGKLGQFVGVMKVNADDINSANKVELLITSIKDIDRNDVENPEGVLDACRDFIEQRVSGLTFVDGNKFEVDVGGDFFINFIVKGGENGPFMIDIETTIEFKLTRGQVETQDAYR